MPSHCGKMERDAILAAAVQPRCDPSQVWTAGDALGVGAIYSELLLLPSGAGAWRQWLSLLYGAGQAHRAEQNSLLAVTCSVPPLCRSGPCLSGRRRVSLHGAFCNGLGLFSLLFSTSHFKEWGGGSGESSSQVMGCQARWLGEGGQEGICFWGGRGSSLCWVLAWPALLCGVVETRGRVGTLRAVIDGAAFMKSLSLIPHACGSSHQLLPCSQGVAS